jgi:hypothetical protein
MNDSDILEVLGWRSIEMLRRYSSGDALRVRQGGVAPFPDTKRAGRAGLAVPSPHPKHVRSLWPHPLTPHAFSIRPSLFSSRRLPILLGVPTTVVSNKKREPLGVRPQKISRCSGRKTPNITDTLEEHQRSAKRLRSSMARSFRQRCCRTDSGGKRRGD